MDWIYDEDTKTYRLIDDETGKLVGEVVESDGQYNVYYSSKRVLLGTMPTLTEAKYLVEEYYV